ncbi:hypothetical protein [Paenisporosarcina quisquiliarum]|uniref:hypothetical protein n=1 Tax=Paenisporosarcina quisquiliarum TaxID=365346 RepID=UPI003736C909
MLFRAELPVGCPKDLGSKKRDFASIYRLVQKEEFDGADFLSPGEEKPERLENPNADICGLLGVSMGTLDYCYKQKKIYKKKFGNSYIAVGQVLASQALSVCDNNNYYHVDFYPFYNTTLERGFKIYTEAQQEA